MNEYAFFEYKAKAVDAMREEPIHCLVKMEIGSRDGRLRERIELEQEAGDVVVFALNPGSHRRISHSTICEVDEERLRQLGPPTALLRLASYSLPFHALNAPATMRTTDASPSYFIHLLLGVKLHDALVRSTVWIQRF
jgi:hypothetical protein